MRDNITFPTLSSKNSNFIRNFHATLWGVIRFDPKRGFSACVPSSCTFPRRRRVPAMRRISVISSSRRAPRPDVTAPASTLRDLAYGLIRVLDEEQRRRSLGTECFRKKSRPSAVMQTRLFEDRMFRSHRQQRHQLFHEIDRRGSHWRRPVAGASRHVFSTYRVLSWLMARGYPLIDLVIKSSPTSAIRCTAASCPFSIRRANTASIPSPAISQPLRSCRSGLGDGKRLPAGTLGAGLYGEGTTAEGNFHEALSLCLGLSRARHSLRHQSMGDIRSYAAGADEATFCRQGRRLRPASCGNSNDFLAVWAATEWAMARARTNLGATPDRVLHLSRRGAFHQRRSPPYRSPPTRPSNSGDPVQRLKAHLIALGEWDEARHTQCEAEPMRSAAKEGEAVGTLGKSKPPVSEMFEDMLKRKIGAPASSAAMNVTMATMSMIQALNSALDVKLSRIPIHLIFGQDVGYFRRRLPCHRGLAEEAWREALLRYADFGKQDVVAAIGVLWPAPRSKTSSLITSCRLRPTLCSEAAPLRYRSGGEFWAPHHGAARPMVAAYLVARPTARALKRCSRM